LSQLLIGNFKTANGKDHIRILHVDDDPCILEVSKEILKLEANFEIDTAYSVDEAFKKLAQKSYDAVVSDYEMPQKDGLQFLQELREKNNSVPFFIFTGKSKEEVAIKALNLGADRYFNKIGNTEILYCELAHAINQAVDRRSAQIDLVKREAKLNAILESSPEAITIADLDGNIVECNRATVDLHCGQSKKEFIGKNSFELIAKKDHKKAIQILKKTIIEGSVKTVEYALLTLSGVEFQGELSASVVRDTLGKPEYVVTITRNISERKKTEADLRRLATIVTDSNDAVTVVDLEGRIIAWNKGAERTYGYSRDEAVGLEVFKIVPEAKKQEILDVIGKIKMNKIVGSFETQRLAKNGRVLDVMLTETKLVDNEGKIVAFATTERDITEKKRLEEKARLSEKFSILGQVASSVAHEIRNPLGVIRNSVYYLNLKLKDTSDEKIAKHLKIMEGNISSADRIISDLLDIGRNKIGPFESVDLNMILELSLARLTIPKDIKVIMKLDKIPKLLLDPEHIQRLFLNVIQNAFAAMPKGGKLTVRLSMSGDWAEISFQDSGEGILEENLQKLFEPLFTTKAKGLGLGLTISKQIVEAHHGEIKISSNAGEGTLVVIRLPFLSEVNLLKPALLLGEISK
jgi:PAS domain S-box-containing protein